MVSDGKFSTDLAVPAPDGATLCRAARLLLAIRQHQLDRGAVPKTLDELVPAYLPAVPLDPCNGRPFHYRAG